MNAPIEESYDLTGSVVSGNTPVAEENHGLVIGGPSRFSETIEQRIASLSAADAEEDVSEEEAIDPPVEGAAEDVAVDAVSEVAPAEPAGAEPDEKPAEAKPTPADDTAALKAEIDRLTKLVAEKPAQAPTEAPPDKKADPLVTAVESYLDDDLGSIRAFLARSIGVDDPNHKDVDAELEYLYTSLTAKSIGVTPDPAHQAARDNARTRQLLARQKRERQAEGDASQRQAKAEAEAAKSREAITLIGNRLGSVSDYPLLMEHARDLDGMAPAELVMRIIQQHSAAGRIDKDTLADDEKLIAYAAKQVETHYQRIADKFRTPTTQTNPSTVTPSVKAPAANESSAKSATATKPTQKSTRTLTNADASVAPAATPAKAATNKDERPKFKSDAERRDYALRRLPK